MSKMGDGSRLVLNFIQTILSGVAIVLILRTPDDLVGISWFLAFYSAVGAIEGYVLGFVEAGGGAAALVSVLMYREMEFAAAVILILGILNLVVFLSKTGLGDSLERAYDWMSGNP